MKFFRDVISKLIVNAYDAHTSFTTADNKAVGDNPVRTLNLDAVSLDNDQSIISLAFDGGNKLFEKTLPAEEAKHTFELISSDMAEAVSLTSNGKIDEAKKLMESLVNKYSEQSGTVVSTNLPPVTTTQASKDEFDGLWKIAKVSLRNIFPSGTIQDLNFDTQEELSSYQEKMQALSPQDRIPLWDQQGQKGEVPGEESPELAPSSLSYSDIEKEKEKEEKNITKRIETEVKEQIESSLEQKQATLFTDKDKELVMALRGVGRSWEEVRDFMTKSLKYEKEDVAAYLDQFRGNEQGEEINVVKEKTLPQMPKPPKELVPDEVHDKLLEDLDKSPLDEKKSEPPVKEEKEPGLSPKDIMDIPEEKESAQEDHKHYQCQTCPKIFNTYEELKEHEKLSVPTKSSLDNEIARADNAEIRKVAAEFIPDQQFSGIPTNVRNELKTEIEHSFYRQNAPGSTSYRFSLDGNKIYRGEYISDLEWDNDDFGPYQFMYNFEMRAYKENPSYKQTAFASLKKQALNPLQVAPQVEEQPTAETSNQDIVPISQTPDHNNMQKGDRVFVMSDLGDEKAGFEGTYVSDYISKGNQFAIIETDEKDLLDVEMHRVSKVSENISPEPAIEPNVQKPEEPEIKVTPKMEDLHSSLKQADETSDEIKFERAVDRLDKRLMKHELSQEQYNAEMAKLKKEIFPKESSLESIKAEVKKLEAQLNEMGKISYKFIKKGLEKHADDSAFEGNGWCRVWVQEDEIAVDPKYPEILKMADENARIKALKEVAREIAHESLRLADSAASKVGVQAWFELLKPSDHDRIDWVALASPQQEEVESSLTATSAKYTKCVKCNKELPVSEMVENVHGAGYLCKEHAKEWNKDASLKQAALRIGDQARISGGTGIDSDKIVTIVAPSEVKTDGRGIPTNVAGAYKPVDFSREVAIKYDDGSIGTMFKNRLLPVESSLKQAADPVPAKTEYKELKKAPDYVDPKSAVPASPDMEQVLVMMESLQSKLSVLDQAKEKIKMAMKQELEKIDVGGERSQIEKELQDSYEKLGILIDATESKVVNWGEKLYTLQHQEKEVVPQPSTKELLAKIYAKFEGAERFVDSVLNGFKALAKKVQTKRLVQWPKRSSLEPVQKEASVMDDFNQLNEEMLKALQALS